MDAIGYFFGSPWPHVAAGLMLVISFVAGLAVLHPRVNDSLLERIALVMICFAAMSRAFYLHEYQTVAVDVLFFTMSVAFYAAVRAVAIIKRNRCAKLDE